MPTQTITTCGRCGKPHDAKWKARQYAVMVQGAVSGNPDVAKTLFAIEDACRSCSEAFERIVKDFAAKFTAERKPRKKKDTGDDSAPLDDHGDHPDRDEPAPVAS